ncbi:MAG: hypothetical protein JSU00_14300 [Acidobacteria bacterium]|nr:hypothetical protein [Acidobacteriota bacterium]
MTLDRRDLMKFTGGGVFGALLTPLPWKLLDDTANWSQNWSWTPKTPRGESRVKYSACTMCPAGCGVKAECVGDRAVAIEGAAAHPVSRGVLCPAGLNAHTAAWHPRRLHNPPAAAIADLSKRIAGGAKYAILDLGPERALSALYREAGAYLRMPDRQEATLNAVARLLGRPEGSLGIDLEHTKTLIAFGAPVMEGWAVPGRVAERWRSGELRLIQVETRQSRSALAAETWIPVEPGGESLVALRIARGEIKVDGPAVAIGAGGPEEEAVAALNLQLGAVGRTIVPRPAAPWKLAEAQDFMKTPDHSIDVLFVDSSRAYDPVPWPAIRRKLSASGVVVALSYRQDAITRHADYVLPVAAPFESLEDAGTPPCSTVPALAVAPALIDSPVVKQSGIDHLHAILGKSGAVADVLKQRAAAIHAAKKGSVVQFADGAATQVSEIASADDLWKKLAEGACWMGEPSAEKLIVKQAAMPQPVIPPRDPQRPFTLLVHNSPDNSLPLMTKLYQESGLYAPTSLARVNPETAAQAGLKSGARAVIDTAYGSAWREVLVDPAVMPGVVEVSACAACSDIAEIATDGSSSDWRVAAANVRRA